MRVRIRVRVRGTCFVVNIRVRVRMNMRVRIRVEAGGGESAQLVTALARRPCLAVRNASLPTTSSLLIDLYYAGATGRLKMSLRGANHA